MAAFEVLSLDPATPQIRAPGAGDTYTFPRQALFLAGTVGAPGIAQTSDDNTGMWWPAADTLAWSTNGSERMRLDSSGNLGLGVVPPSMSGVTGLVGNYLNIVGGSGFYASGNAYYNGAWKYYGTGTAGEYEIVSGEHRFNTTSVSGTAGNTISFTQAMTLDTSGNLGVGITVPTTRLEVNNGINNTNGTTTVRIVSGTAGADPAGFIGTVQNHLLAFRINNSEVARMPTAGGMVVGTAALATNATGGFLYVPTCAGTPTGTPTAYTGTAPIVVDTTNNKLYFYSGGQWRDAGP